MQNQRLNGKEGCEHGSLLSGPVYHWPVVVPSTRESSLLIIVSYRSRGGGETHSRQVISKGTVTWVAEKRKQQSGDKAFHCSLSCWHWPSGQQGDTRSATQL